jgi:hypothetical protein
LFVVCCPDTFVVVSFVSGIFMLVDCWLLYELVIGYAVGLLAGWTIGQLTDSAYLFAPLGGVSGAQSCS